MCFDMIFHKIKAYPGHIKAVILATGVIQHHHCIT